MYNYLIGLNWQLIEPIILMLLVSVILALLIKFPSIILKVLKIGICFFMITILIDIAGLPQIANHFSVFGFTIISVSLLCLFWSYTKKE